MTKAYRRRREGKTNYHKRLAMLKGDKLRLVVRKSLKNISAQIVEYHPDGDKVLVGVSSRQLEKLGWKVEKRNIPAAYLTGFMLGKKALAAKIKGAIADIGLQANIKGAKIYAVIKGAIDAGMEIPCDESVFPSADHLEGKAVAGSAEKLAKENADKYQKLFSQYMKNGLKPEHLPKQV